MDRAREVFAADGVVRLPGRLAASDVAAMRGELLARVEGLPRVEVGGALRVGPGGDEVLWEVGRQPPFAALDRALRGALAEVFGPGRWAPVDGQVGGLAMPCWPIAGRAWSVPHEAWHVDEPTTAHPSGWGLLGFAFLDRVEPGGGATVAIAGSPRRLALLAAELGKAVLTTEEAIAALAAEDWFRVLFAPGDRRRHMVPGHRSAGVPVQVVELTGEPGDLTLMDPRCLHTVSANTSTRARLAMRMTCRRLA